MSNEDGRRSAVGRRERSKLAERWWLSDSKQPSHLASRIDRHAGDIHQHCKPLQFLIRPDL